MRINLNEIIIRNETEADYKAVENLTREAFWNHHVPGCDEHYLLHVMRHDPSFIKELDVVAEMDGILVGNIVYVKSILLEDSGDRHEVLCFGPLSVLPTYQKQGIGRLLIEYTVEKAKDLGYKAIFIYGDPEYYKRFGFVKAEQFNIATSENTFMDALQALELEKNILMNRSGQFIENPIYSVDHDSAKIFDEQFPPKPLEEGLPSQLRFLETLKLSKPRL